MSSCRRPFDSRAPSVTLPSLNTQSCPAISCHGLTSRYRHTGRKGEAPDSSKTMQQQAGLFVGQVLEDGQLLFHVSCPQTVAKVKCDLTFSQETSRSIPKYGGRLHQHRRPVSLLMADPCALSNTSSSLPCVSHLSSTVYTADVISSSWVISCFPPQAALTPSFFLLLGGALSIGASPDIITSHSCLIPTVSTLQDCSEPARHNFNPSTLHS